jgi:hypothetical protein
MNKIATLVSIAALATATACAGPYHHRNGATADFDVYYDGYYGNYGGGYWGSDGYFYYSDGSGHYRRDDERHFHRERFDRGTPYHSDRHDPDHD